MMGTIKGLFHAAAKVLARRDHDERPQSRRRRGENVGGFRRLARGLLRTVFKRGAAARGRYGVLRDPPPVQASPANTITVPAEYLYADLDWNAFDIANPLHDHGDVFDNDGSFDSYFDTVKEYLSPGL
jgi:hypothetical protein